MAITHEREEMRIAMQLKQEGWIHDITDLSVLECQERAEWCRDAFGPRYSQLYPDAWASKWFGAILPFQTGSITPNRQFVFMFRDDKIYTMYKLMWPE